MFVNIVVCARHGQLPLVLAGDCLLYGFQVICSWCFPSDGKRDWCPRFPWPALVESLL